MATATFDVIDNAWDFYWTPRAAKGETGQLLVGMARANTPRHTAIGFGPVTIPQGATITSATLRLAGLADRTTSVQTEIRAVLAAVPDWPLTEDEAEAFVLTIAGVPWNDIVLQAGVVQDSPDIAAVLQAVVSLPDWTPGGTLAVVIRDAGSPVGQLAGWHSADSFHGTHPQLVVEWT